MVAPALKPPKTLVKACSIVQERHATLLNINRGDGNWCVHIGNGGLIFSDQFLETCKLSVDGFAEIIENEVIFRGVALQVQQRKAI